MIERVVLSLLVVAMLATPAWAATAKTDYTPEQALAYSQDALGRSVSGDYTFVDASGKTVQLSDYLGKPLIVNFVYTSCTDTCPIITQTLADAADVARSALGDKSFNVITVGFDSAADTSERMRYFATVNGINMDGWDFLSSDLLTIKGFTDTLGFIYYRSPQGFNHLAQVTIIDAKGVIYRQVYGNSFDTPLLVEPLKELIFGTEAPFSSIADLIKKVRLFCTIYDPAADRYRFDYSIFIKLIVGSLVIGSMAVFLVREWWRIFKQRRRRNSIKPPVHPASGI